MAERTSEELVREIVEWQSGEEGLEPPIPLKPFIRQANILTDWLASEDTDSKLSSSTLKEIETLLAAHFYQVHRDLGYQSKSTDGASGAFQGQTSFALQATHHGQTAMVLDVTGALTKRNIESQTGIRKASTTWLGWQDHSADPYP